MYGRPTLPPDQPAAPAGVPWARIGEFVGQRSLSVTADVYSHVLSEETELEYAALLTG